MIYSPEVARDFFNAAARGRAIGRVVAFERDRTLNTSLVNSHDDDLLTTDEALFLMRQAAALDEMLSSEPLEAAAGALERLDAYLEDEILTSSTLAFVDMHGEWQLADEAEDALREARTIFAKHGYDRLMLPGRDSPYSKRTMNIMPEVTGQDGLVAIRMRRLLLTAEASDGSKSPLNIDKVSSHVMDLNALGNLVHVGGNPKRAEEAIREIKLILMAHELRQVNIELLNPDSPERGIFDDMGELRDKLPASMIDNIAAEQGDYVDYQAARLEALAHLESFQERMIAAGFTTGEVVHRLNMLHSDQIKNWDNHLFLLNIMRLGTDGGGVFTPAVTSYYIHKVQTKPEDLS